MDHSALTRLLRDAWAERPLSRSEKRALKAALTELADDPSELALARHHVFELARELGGDERLDVVLEWTEDLVKILAGDTESAAPVSTLAFFSPGDDCRNAIVAALRNARRSARLCVFTISDDYLTEAIIAAHTRGVDLKIITDDDKSFDSGSDIGRMHRAGLAIKIDDDPDHMHHKFAVFDDKLLLTGSYNWTRSAATRNQENILQTDAPDAIRAFTDKFDELWKTMPDYR